MQINLNIFVHDDLCVNHHNQELACMPFSFNPFIQGQTKTHCACVIHFAIRKTPFQTFMQIIKYVGCITH